MRCLMIPVLLVLAGCGGEKAVTITQAEYGAKWPFTVEKVDLLCQDGPPSALVRTEDGKLYALNGSARSRASKNGWLDGQSITKPNASMPGITMDYSEITVRAMKLCPSYAG
ncbi:hypothetical protein J2Y83_004241 [Pseudomonas marginalis]|uniref:DUF2511 domain-containing protein n=1 Tax=Pseudomonas marginalis TaxID=298 RepID=UPI0020A1291D|nr:DUF2511 domain-containing protein [Pseudomonas marginalis]MCP1508268.1 hypothetical protein [Pseudomonas marginalis]MCP1525772.1 hypothetical protein [Pseudomonas marginalis]MDQ0498914.1 hypothetical protein [Pseudomonas marginalis]